MSRSMSLPPVVPLRDALVVIAVLIIVAVASNLALYAYLSTQSSLSVPPSPARGECVWEKGPGDEGPGEAGSSPFTPRPLAGPWMGSNRPGVRALAGREPLP